MFDIGAAEILVIAIVAILVIGPKDMPMAMRTAGRWIGQIRRVSSHFRAGIDAMVREAEMEDMEKKWQERNAQIMRDHPGEMTPLPPSPPADDASGPQDEQEGARASASHDPHSDDPVPNEGPSPASAEARMRPVDKDIESGAEPQLPLEKDGKA
ncbi:Sec-independent protein translocase protein TatB [Alteriqipengyuania lutimaris]|uniref:Sec-independent protein translocase protein TatB n=1 Tax=Alteriqipengyuania lutimaris TaxID=1538146 RepID=A0A395LKT8_9SPHN|nr:Sec-independent protein translocase protein TatB [Alteriqipengyuania lutimaris]MBB3033428.1 sec-independent protein translocase protein TatB [Alteriqipengyuania lutimaris]RDS77552.1 twin-arginine translocase subunit TatB [Alteriqipengyuania lutimaris]